MIAFVFDEQMRGRAMAVVRRHNAAGGDPIDATEVGEPGDLPTGTSDPDLLRWAEANGRVVVSLDYNTMPGHLTAHLTAGRSSPGVLLVRPRTTYAALVDELALIAHAADPAEYADQAKFIP